MAQPHKGQRELFATRLPLEEALQMRELANTLGLTLTDTLHALVRIGYRHRDDLHRVLPARRHQEELPLNKAS